MSDVIMLFPKTGEDMGGSITPPFGVLAASSIINQEGYKIKIIDQRIDKNWKNTLAGELKTNPLFAGISCMTGSQIGFALEMTKFLKENNKDIPLIWGGMHPTILPMQTLQDENVDIVVIGEGEETLRDLTHAIEKNIPLKAVEGIAYKKDGKVFQNGLRNLLDPNTLPETPWNLINSEDYITASLYVSEGKRMMDIGETSRGCPYRCAFCCSSEVKRHIWRPMTAEKSIDLIVNNVKRFNLDSIWLRDDNFYVDLKRAENIFKGIIDSGIDIKWYTAGTRMNSFLSMTPEFIKLMIKSGGNALKFGAESGSNRILKMVSKGQTVNDILTANRRAKKYDLISSYAFIGGFPTETIDELMMTIDLMIRLPKENPKAIIESLCMYTPHPCTKLYDVAMQLGLKPPTKLADWASWSYYNEAQMTWFSDDEKKILKNACDICIYGGNLIRVLKTEKNILKRYAYLFMFYPFIKYYGYKWEHKKFGNDPILKGLRFVRKTFMDKSIKV